MDINIESRLKGYASLPLLALAEAGCSDAQVEQFKRDWREVVHQLFMENSWLIARDRIHAAGLQFYWEPYTGPFDTYIGTGLADVPMGEFWTEGNGAISDVIVNAASYYGKKVVGAEAFTGAPGVSQYTEDPEFLKPLADGAFLSGVNRLFLHHWVHQPFDDRYQPAMSMGWWGTHFGRHQTWARPAKAFFTYLSRCQMMLQQGRFVSTDHTVLHRTSPEADIYFIINPSDTTSCRDYTFCTPHGKPELWDAYSGQILRPSRWHRADDSVSVQLSLTPHQSLFVVFPKTRHHAPLTVKERPVEQSISTEIPGAWSVEFCPKLSAPFVKPLSTLTDFTESDDPRVRYFSGTAIYRTTVNLPRRALSRGKRLMLDLGRVNDIVEVSINGNPAIVLWYPPYVLDVTPYLQQGDNLIELSVTNNWANRLIGDEQHPADFEWGDDRGDRGHAIKAFPEWFTTHRERPQQGRTGFLIWYYHRAHSPLQPSGLCGPVRLVEQQLGK